MNKKVLFTLILCAALLNIPARAANVPIEENVKTFLNNIEDAIYKMDTYTCKMYLENWKDKKHEYKILKFYFKKPNLMRMDVLEGDNKGGVVLLNKEGKIRGKNWLGITLTLRPDDGRIRNLRGDSFMQSSLLNMLARLKNHILERGCKASLAEEECMKRPAYHLHIEHNDADDPVTLEDVWYDKNTYFIMKKIKYEGRAKVTDIVWENCEINIPLADSLFVQ